MKSFQDREPNFRDGSGNIYLVRCFSCDKDHGKENWAPMVAEGKCAWCGWEEKKDTKQLDQNQIWG